jgi:hypothetical protein
MTLVSAGDNSGFVVHIEDAAAEWGGVKFTEMLRFGGQSIRYARPVQQAVCPGCRRLVDRRVRPARGWSLSVSKPELFYGGSAGP